MSGRKKVLWFGDGFAKTGFAQVNTNIIKNLPSERFDVHHVAINYFGDPHENTWKMYPAAIRGDIWGYNRIPEFVDDGFDGIFILNDIWVIARYLERIKKEFNSNNIPSIVTYFPIDAVDLDPIWFKDFDIVSRAVAYTKFGQNQVQEATQVVIPDVIPHGVDTSIFYKMNESKMEIKKKIYPNRPDFIDSFIFLNANRNQPRKKLDLTMEGFALFAKGKPENVKLYTHCGMKDVGIDILKFAFRLGIDNRLIITNTGRVIQSVSDEKLNLIYNATDAGVNTSIGEGWGLTAHEHAATGAPQIVPDHSACKELFEDCGSLIPIYYRMRNNDTLTQSSYVRPEDVAEQMQQLYTNPELFERNSTKCYNKFTSEEYQWPYIVENYWVPLFDEAL